MRNLSRFLLGTAVSAFLAGAAAAAPFAYITNAASETVSVIDTASNTVVATVRVSSGPIGVAVNPSGTRVYVANLTSNSVSVIDTADQCRHRHCDIGRQSARCRSKPERHARLRHDGVLEQRFGHRHGNQHGRRHRRDGHHARRHCREPERNARLRGHRRRH